MSGHADLIRSLPFDEFFAAHERCRELAASICQSAAELESLATGTLGVKYGADLRVQGACGDSGFLLSETRDDRSPARAIMRRIERSAWRELFDRSGYRSIMSASARQQFDEDVEKGRLPPLTADNVIATFEALRENRVAMMEDGVVDAFRSLSWDYKTNSPVKFGKRAIFKGYDCMCGRWWNVCHYGQDKLDDLLRVLHVLDGRPAPDHREGARALLQAALPSGAGGGESEDEMVGVRSFKNGNVHVTFKRRDLVDRMNQIVASRYPHALPAAS